jgi:predicted Zn-dependent peptidase
VLAELVDARMRVVRERLGASYGLHVEANKQAIWIDGAVEPAYAAQAFKAIAEELARIRANDPALAEDLARAKNHVLARALALPVAASQRAAMLERIVVGGGDAEQVDTEVQAIRGVELEAVQRLAVGVIEPARMIAAVRGDRRAVAAALDALGVAKGTIEWIEDKKAGGQQVRPAETPKVAGPKN